VATYFSFEGYKEFKAMHQEQIGDPNAGSFGQNPISYGSMGNYYT
jgi:hypothetical protein